MFRRIDNHTLVAGQLRLEDVARAAADGVTMIVNNRPDDEQPGQPRGAEIEAAARAAGVDYRHIPIAGGFSQPQIDAMAAAIESSGGKLLAFCRSGTRSTFLWALARAQAGDGAEEIETKAAGAGYDLAPIRSYLR